MAQLPAADTNTPYDREAILHEDGPLDPRFMEEAIRTMMRAMPLDPAEPRGWAYRRMHAATRALAALHPRDEIEVMLGTQAMCAFQAASMCWRLGMNVRRPCGDSTRHIAAAGSAARTFDAMVRAVERRQAKPLSVPVGRPPARVWPVVDLSAEAMRWEDRCRGGLVDPTGGGEVTWTAADVAFAVELKERERIEKENEGLDIANTEGILPGGGMVMPENPTPEQAAYLGRRLVLMYRREHEENLRNGAPTVKRIRPIRTGDIVP